MNETARSLLRTNIKLTGNLKLALHTEVSKKGNSQTPAEAEIGNVYLEPVESVLPSFNVRANLYSSSYEYDVKTFYDYYKDFFYSLNNTTQYNKNNRYYISLNESDARDSNFEFGCKRVSYDKNGRQMAFLAPLYLTDKTQFPDKFVIECKNKTSGRNDIRKIVVDLHKNELWNKYITRYIEQIDGRIIKLDVDSFNSYCFGIDARHGGFIKAKDNISKSLFASELTLVEFDNIITNSFMKNNMVMSQILNMAFYFDISNEFFDDINPRETDISDFFVDWEISGYYAYNNENTEKVPFYDLDFDYYEEWINNYTSREESLQNENTNHNVFDLLGENTYTEFKYISKQVPQINKWSMLSDENYRINLSDAYSSKELKNGYYGATLPISDTEPALIKTGGESVNYNLNWFEYPENIDAEFLPETIYDTEGIKKYLSLFINRKSLSVIKQNSTFYKGYQYTFTDKIAKEEPLENRYFGIVLVPVKQFLNTSFYYKFDTEKLYKITSGDKTAYLYTILFNIPISYENGTVDITPEILYNIYFDTKGTSQNIFSLIPTNINVNKDNFSINKISLSRVSNSIKFDFDENAKRLSVLKNASMDYLNEYLNKSSSETKETLKIFENILLLSFAANITNNVLYMNYDSANDELINNIYYLDINTAQRLLQLYKTKNAFSYKTSTGIDIVDLHEEIYLKKLLNEPWLYYMLISSPLKQNNPQYAPRVSLDSILNLIINMNSLSDSKYTYYLKLLRGDSDMIDDEENPVGKLIFTWTDIKNNILNTGLLLDSVSEDSDAGEYLRFTLNEIPKRNYTTRSDTITNIYYLKYSLNRDGNPILAVTNLGSMIPHNSESDIWNGTRSYNIYQKLLSGTYYFVDYAGTSDMQLNKTVISGLLPKYIPFVEYCPPYYITLQKRLLKTPVSIFNKSNVEETSIEIYKKSDVKIKMYRYMGFIMPKMYKIEKIGPANDESKQTAYIKNYIMKKVKNTDNVLLSYTSQTDYLPVYESIDEYTLYRPKKELYFDGDSDRYETRTINGIDINKFAGNRIYSTFGNYDLHVPLEYKYFNASRLHNLPVRIKIERTTKNSGFTEKELLYNYIVEHYSYLNFSNDDINFFVDQYSYKEMKEYADKNTAKFIRQIIYTLK